MLTMPLHAQQWNWAVDAGGGGNTDFCWDIATDSQGNAYWVGSVSGTADFGCATLNPGNTIAGVLAKYDANGDCQWAVGITTSFYDAWVYGIAIDAQDRIYITGSCQGTTDFGNGISLPGSGSSDDWFTARYDVNGNCVWAKRIANSSASSEGRGIALDEDGGVYVTGFAGGTSFTFDPLTVSTGGFARQAVIVKYDSTGAAQWARSTIGTGGGKSARAITIADDRLYITGQMNFNNASYDGIPLTPNATSGNLYVLACDLQGNGLWARSYGPGDNEGFGIAADTLGNVFVVGRLWGTMILPDDSLASLSNNDDIILLAFDREGAYRWGKSTGSVGRDLAWGVTTDGLGNAYVSAHFNSTIDFFGTTLTALGSEDALIAKVEADGDIAWVARPSGYQRDIPLCVHRQAVAPHRLFFGGYYFGLITYGNTTMNDVGNGDAMMISGIDTTFDVSLVVGPTCPGACDGSITTFVNGRAPFSYQWSTGATMADQQGLCPGVYIVEVTDSLGQVIMDTVFIEEATDPGYTVQVLSDSLWISGGTAWQWFLDGQVLSGPDSASLIAPLTGDYFARVTDAFGCSWSSDTVLVVLNVGVMRPVASSLVVHPNPVGERLFIRTDGTVVQALATDATGRIVRLPLRSTGSLDTQALAPGVWAVQITLTDGRSLTGRFVRE
jgi:hypothetical protein